MELVTGPFRPALEDAFRQAFARLRKDDPLAPLAVVAPSRRLANRLKELALEAIPQGFAAARFFNLFSFARTVYDEAAPPGTRVVLDDLVPENVVRSILRRHFKDDRYLSRAGLAHSGILGALHELKAAAVNPDHALTLLAFKDLGLEDAPKLASILSLYKRYAEELRRRRLHERADVVRLAADRAPRSPWLGTLRHVLYYGFYDLDQNQLDLLREVRLRVPVTVFFPYAPTPAYAYARDFLENILRPLARETRELPASPPKPRTSVAAASGAQDEVWAAAKEILRLADAGIPYDSIGLVARTLDPYLDALEPALREHKIPFTSSAQRKLDRDPRVKAARLLFSLGDFDRADVMDLIRSPFFALVVGDTALWDRASRLMGIGHGGDEWARRLGGAAGQDFVHSRSQRADDRRFVLPRAEVDLFWFAVRALLEPDPPPETWTSFSEWALRRYRRFLKPEPRIEAAIGSLASLEGLAMDDPVATLLDLLSRLSQPVGGEAGVQVLDAMAARGLPFRALVVLGMNERVFPRFILQEPFLRDAVRARIEYKLGCRLPRKLQGYDEETLLYELLLGSADEVALLYQRSDDKGRLQIPSSFLPGGDADQVPRRPAERLLSRPFELLTPREASLRTGEGEALGRAIGWDVTVLVNGVSFIRTIEERGPLTKYDGLIDARQYWNAVASFGLSPTALERLWECPFRYFASKMLDLEELEAPEAEDSLTAMETGEIYHDVLEKHYRAPGDVDAQFDAAFARFEERRTIRYPVLWEVEKRKIRQVVKAFLKRDDLSRFKPAEFEKGLRAEVPLEVGGRRTVAFRGFVDRLDLGPGKTFRVVDYKKSRGKYRYSMEKGVFEKGYLQPPIYFLLAKEALKDANVEGSKFSYFFVEEAAGGEEKWELPLEGSFLRDRSRLEELLRGVLESIPRGTFAIRPGGHCDFCDHRTVCRRGHLPTRLRAEQGLVATEEGRLL